MYSIGWELFSLRIYWNFIPNWSFFEISLFLPRCLITIKLMYSFRNWAESSMFNVFFAIFARFFLLGSFSQSNRFCGAEFEEVDTNVFFSIFLRFFWDENRKFDCIISYQFSPLFFTTFVLLSDESSLRMVSGIKVGWKYLIPCFSRTCLLSPSISTF